jgi:hypothetical protein
MVRATERTAIAPTESQAAVAPLGNILTLICKKVLKVFMSRAKFICEFEGTYKVSNSSIPTLNPIRS